MDPVPYEIREDDVDEVLSAYEGVGGGDFSEEVRSQARRHVMRHVLDIDELVRTAPEERRLRQREVAAETPAGGMAAAAVPADESYPRRELALAVIEDLLIRDGFIDAAEEETRVFPIMIERDDRGE
ncbi:MAG TPA: hypothetical protein VMN60_14470 [Longimicrobiales bacterium]|nr:hypothetical protein [Longimicrobiales bacterium]